MDTFRTLTRNVRWPLALVAMILGSIATSHEVAADPSGPGIATHYLCDTSDWPTYTCVGIDANAGGAITSLETDWTLPWLWNSNVVDNGLPDKGRQIQASLYHSGESYPPNCWPCNPGCNWGWNPVQAGSCSNQGSGNLQVTQTSNSIYTRSRPLQWDNALGTSNVILEQELRFVLSNALKMTYTITNNESFTIDRPHELPVAYLETRLSQPVAYTGAAPFTDGAVTQFNIPLGSSVSPSATERWIAWLHPSGPGVAIYMPLQSSAQPEVWTLGRLNDTAPTNYLQNWARLRLQPGQTKTIVVYLITGTVDEIRDAVYSLEGIP